MAQQDLIIGAANANGGDNYFDAFGKIQGNFDELYRLAGPENQVIVNSLADLPTPVAGVITLVSDTQYLIGANVNVGTDRVRMTSNSSIRGSGRLSVTISYTGTADLFTVVNDTCRIENITISCTSGRVLNFSDNTDTLFIMDECTIICDRIALFNSAGSLGSIIRVSNTTINSSTSGVSFIGNWNRVLWLTSGINMLLGNTFDLGTATFNSIIMDTVGINLSIGVNFLSGALSSANINAGGVGQLISVRSSGSGTMLNGISTNDSRWEFYHNNKIPDTRTDALISMNDNVTETVITAIDTPVLVAGTWAIKSSSQTTVTAAGRVTSNVDKAKKLNTSLAVRLSPVSGSKILLSVYIAIDGVVDASSKRTLEASAGLPESVSLPWQVTFTEGTYVELFVENNSTTSNIICSRAALRVN